MQRSLEQCYAIKICVKLGKSGSETLQLLRTAYGDAVLSSSQVLRQYKALKDGREGVETNSVQGVLHLQELRTMWLMRRLFWIGTDF